MYNGLGENTNGAITNFQNLVFEGASQLGLAFPSQESTVWWWAVAAPLVLSYLFATPGSLSGLADYVYAPMHAESFRSFTADDVEIGRQLGEGSFGVVYEGFFGRDKRGAKSGGLHVVLKKAKRGVEGASEVHTSEIHMNYRLQRTASYACAEFLGTMQVKPNHARGKLSQGVWLIWNFQGDRSLDYYLKQKNFPENLSATILRESSQAVSKGELFKRNFATIKSVFRQILSNLQDLHRSGVVHRDVKPLNLILDQDSSMFKFIDFGACVDLRSGFNYVPKETVIDPTYAAPEHYVMPTSTPNLPPDPLCSLISPFLWLLNTPDRFDLYSAGLILMQLSLKPLRHDSGLQAFNTELKRANYNLKSWRANCRYSREEFSYLDADGGAGWELVTALLQPRHDMDNLIWPSLGNSRPSAAAALQHRFFKGTFVMPKLFPKEQEDVTAVRVLPPFEGVLPAFESVAQKLSSAAMNVVSATRGNLPVPTLEKKAKLNVSFNPPRPFVPNVADIMISDKQQSGLKNVKTKEPDNVSILRSNPALASKTRVPPSSSTVTEKVNRMIQDAFNRRTETAGCENASTAGSKKIDAATSGGKKVDGVASSSIVREKISHMMHGAFNGQADMPGRKNMNAATSAGEKVDVARASTVKPLVEEQEKSVGPSNLERTGTVFSSIGAALPVAATSAVALATGWLVMSGLSSSAQASYELGKLLMSSSGISGSAFLAFFLVLKPWIEEQGALLSEKKARNDPAEGGSHEITQLEKYKSIHAGPIKVQVVVEAVQELELQISSLEALMLREQQVSREHKELVQKMESLLLEPLAFQDKTALLEIERS